MAVLKLTKAELAAVDAMIATLEKKGAGKGTKFRSWRSGSRSRS
jgi:hypothetical protein